MVLINKTDVMVELKLDSSWRSNLFNFSCNILVFTACNSIVADRRHFKVCNSINFKLFWASLKQNADKSFNEAGYIIDILQKFDWLKVFYGVIFCMYEFKFVTNKYGMAHMISLHFNFGNVFILMI